MNVFCDLDPLNSHATHRRAAVAIYYYTSNRGFELRGLEMRRLKEKQRGNNRSRKEAFHV